MLLREQRLKSNLKIKGICKALGISRSTYYLMESGKRQIKPGEELILKQLFKEEAV